MWACPRLHKKKIISKKGNKALIPKFFMYIYIKEKICSHTDKDIHVCMYSNECIYCIDICLQVICVHIHIWTHPAYVQEYQDNGNMSE